MIKRLLVIAIISVMQAGFAASIAYFPGQDDTLGFDGTKFIGQFAPLMTCIHESANLELSNVRGIPAARQLAMLKQGELDVALTLQKTPDRDDIGVATSPVLTLEVWLLTRDDAVTPTTLAGKKIVTLRGASVVETIEAAGAEALVVSGYDQALKMAHSGRADAAIIPSAVSASLDSAELTAMTTHVLSKVEIVNYVSRKSAQLDALLASYNSAIAACTSN